MSGKFRSREEFQKVKNNFFENCKNSGKNEAFTADVWRQIESFAGYAFAKGHSASYAVESYQSLFLKAYFPLEYMVATLNNGGGFYSTELYVHEARMHGANILQPCINRSFAETVIDGKDIYIGFRIFAVFGIETYRKDNSERNKNGTFESLDDLLERVSIGMEQVAILIKINAFRFTERNKRELLWEAYMKINKVSFEENAPTLFKPKRIDYQTPSLPHTALEDAFDEMELLGFPLCSPFDLLENPSENKMRAAHLPKFIGKTITIEGYLVTTKRTKTSRGDSMYFGNFVDRDGDFIDTVHFPPVAAQYRFRGKGIYSITGKVVEEFDCITIEVSKMERLAIIQDPRYSSTSLPPEGGTVTDNRRTTLENRRKTAAL